MRNKSSSDDGLTAVEAVFVIEGAASDGRTQQAAAMTDTKASALYPFIAANINPRQYYLHVVSQSEVVVEAFGNSTINTPLSQLRINLPICPPNYPPINMIIYKKKH